MALSNAEKQKRYRQRRHARDDKHLNMMVDFEAFGYMSQLATHWDCTKREAYERIMREIWEKYEEEVTQ